MRPVVLTLDERDLLPYDVPIPRGGIIDAKPYPCSWQPDHKIKRMKRKAKQQRGKKARK
jgi:hypothetical protein